MTSNRKRRAAQTPLSNNACRTFCRCLALSSLCMTQHGTLLGIGVGAFAPTVPSLVVGRPESFIHDVTEGPVVMNVNSGESNGGRQAVRRMGLLMASTSTASAVDWTELTQHKKPKKEIKRRRRKAATGTKTLTSPTLYQNNMNMYNHRLLTKEDELELAQEMELGRILKERIDSVVASKLLNNSELEDEESLVVNNADADGQGVKPGRIDVDQEWNNLMRSVERNVPANQDEDADVADSIGANANPYHKSFLSWLRHGSGGDTEAEASGQALKTRHSYISKVSAKSPYYEPPAFLGMLTEDDLKTGLDLPQGTMAELLTVLTTAHEARQELLKCNMKLVLSIARRWHANSFVKDTPFGERQDVPSLDELVQEGTVGLVKAVDKFDGGKQNRFSTYATYWISSYVRMAMQRSKTSVMKVPVDLHYLNQKYHALMARIREEGHVQHFDNDNDSPHGGDTYAVLSLEEAAHRLKVKPKKLKLALRASQAVVSLDGPYKSSTTAFKGSAAGGDITGRELTLGDALSSETHSEIPQPEAYVDLSLLRHNLERVMSAELLPYERDILRLRLGLDDGQTRSIREIADITNTPVNKIFPGEHSNNTSGGSGNKRIISMSEVRSAEKRAFRKLRDPVTLKTYQLHDFLQAYG
jgi:RNA polymerase sigma factor (sigma-70 family)